jgi:hypothetical protein
MAKQRTSLGRARDAFNDLMRTATKARDALREREEALREAARRKGLAVEASLAEALMRRGEPDPTKFADAQLASFAISEMSSIREINRSLRARLDSEATKEAPKQEKIALARIESLRSQIEAIESRQSRRSAKSAAREIGVESSEERAAWAKPGRFVAFFATKEKKAGWRAIEAFEKTHRVSLWSELEADEKDAAATAALRVERMEAGQELEASRKRIAEIAKWREQIVPEEEIKRTWSKRVGQRLGRFDNARLAACVKDLDPGLWPKIEALRAGAAIATRAAEIAESNRKAAEKMASSLKKPCDDLQRSIYRAGQSHQIQIDIDAAKIPVEKAAAALTEAADRALAVLPAIDEAIQKAGSASQRVLREATEAQRRGTAGGSGSAMRDPSPSSPSDCFASSQWMLMWILLSQSSQGTERAAALGQAIGCPGLPGSLVAAGLSGQSLADWDRQAMEAQRRAAEAAGAAAAMGSAARAADVAAGSGAFDLGAPSGASGMDFGSISAHAHAAAAGASAASEAAGVSAAALLGLGAAAMDMPGLPAISAGAFEVPKTDLPAFDLGASAPVFEMPKIDTPALDLSQAFSLPSIDLPAMGSFEVPSVSIPTVEVPAPAAFDFGNVVTGDAGGGFGGFGADSPPGVGSDTFSF